MLRRYSAQYNTKIIMLLQFLIPFALVAAASAKKCPTPTRGFVSNGGGKRHVVNFVNRVGTAVDAVWVAADGSERREHAHLVEWGATERIDSFTGHAFRFYTTATAKFVGEYRVVAGEGSFTVPACDGAPQDPEPGVPGGGAFVSPRAAEIAALVHDQAAPCDGPSNTWSCIRKYTAAEYKARPAHLYGFANKKEAGHRAVGATVDTGYTRHIPKIPRITTGPGYLKMDFTRRMKDILLQWYVDHGKGGPKDSVQKHEVISGGYTNNHVAAMSKLDLDDFRPVQRAVAAELRAVLEWWTGRSLKHTSTFGVRIYHRDSMLINHVDRADTHLASAVIQLAQHDVDADGGWPLEILDAEGNCAEVYMQPGQMVLYEGARFRHGRPMRFRGVGFANIFSHFAPLDWHGPGKSPRYDGTMDARGYDAGHGGLPGKAPPKDEL